jgi:cation transport ATPase
MLIFAGLILSSVSLYSGNQILKKKKIATDKKAKENLPVFSTSSTVITQEPKDKNFTIASASLSCVIGGHLLFPPLGLVGASGLAYLTIPTWKQAYYDLTKKRRFTRMALESMILPATLLSGHFLIAASAYWFLYFSFYNAAKAKGNACKNLSELFLTSANQSVYMLREGVEIEVTLQTLQIDDIIVLNAGEIIPIDGVIIKGDASINKHLTADKTESIKKKINDTVLAGTYLLEGHIQVKVTKTGQNTLATQSHQALDKMTAYTDTLELRGTDAGDRLALPYFILGTITGVLKGASSGLAVVWAPADDALYLTGPLCVLNYINIAMQRKILVKDGRALETLRHVDTFLLDKKSILINNNPASILSTIKTLRKLGYQVCIVSDDKETLTEDLAQQWQVDHYFVEQQQKEKVERIKSLQKKGHVICYIADGLHDAVSLHQADVSVSLRGASDLSTDVAHVILLREKLEQLIDLIALSKELEHTYKKTVLSSTIPSVAIVGGVFLFNFGLVIALTGYLIGMGMSLTQAMLPLLKEKYNAKHESKK